MKFTKIYRNLIVYGSTSVEDLSIGSVTFPSIDGLPGQVLTTDGLGTISWQNGAVLYDNDTIKLNGSNELYVDETSLTILTSQITNFSIEVENVVFDLLNFNDSTTIDFTVNPGSSTTAEVKLGSLTEDYLSIIGSPSAGLIGQFLSSDGLGNFIWQDINAGEAIEIGAYNTFDVLYDGNSIKLNGLNKLYVDETVLTITVPQITNFSTEVENVVFDLLNFNDSTTIDFTVNPGSSTTAEVIPGSLTENYLSITGSPASGSAGDILISDGTGGFIWNGILNLNSIDAQVFGDIIPNPTQILNLGSSLNEWNGVYAVNINGSGLASINNLTVSGTSNFLDNVQIIAEISHLGDLTANGSYEINGPLTVYLPPSSPLVNAVNVTGNSSFIGNLEITGEFNVNGDSAIVGELSITGNVGVIGNTTLNGLTVVYGDTPTSAAIRPGANNTYDLGAPSFRWREIFTTNIDVSNSATIEFLSVNGTSNFYNTANFNSGGVNINGDLNITGNTLMNGELDVNGPVEITYISSSPSIPALSITGLTDMIGNLNIIGDQLINGSVEIYTPPGSPNLEALKVTGDSNFYGNINVIGNLDYLGDLVVTGSATVDEFTLTTGGSDGYHLISNAIGDSSWQRIELNVQTSSGPSYTIATAIRDYEYAVGLDTTSSAIALNLPPASYGKIIVRIKDIGANSFNNKITVNADGSDTIITATVGNSSFILETDGGSVTLISDGLNTWWLT